MACQVTWLGYTATGRLGVECFAAGLVGVLQGVGPGGAWPVDAGGDQEMVNQEWEIMLLGRWCRW